ncbi:hypothetical protein [Erwinia phage vB_Ea277G]|jgi:hypothetical protein|nr:hypothetical protein [Erwinia phage vB_Ea277G]
MSYSTDEFWREFRPIRQTLFGLVCTWVLSQQLLDWLHPTSECMYILAGLSAGLIGFGFICMLDSPKRSLARADACWWCWHWGVILTVIVLF